MKRTYCLVFAFFFPFLSHALVDTKSAGYSKTFVDFRDASKSLPLKLERAYNSRSLYNGLFGFGWCSNIETKMDIFPDGSVKSTECGAGMEVVYHEAKKTLNVGLQVDLILKGVRKKQGNISRSDLNRLKKDLLDSQTLRSDFLKALNIKGRIIEGVRYYANGRLNEYVEGRNGQLYRKLSNGVTEVYNKEGRLVRIYDKYDSDVRITWTSKAVYMGDRSRRLELALDEKSGKVKEVKFRGRRVSQYKHNAREDLVYVKNNYKEVFLYSYDKLHNLTQITYPDKTKEILSYNTKKDWVMSFVNRKGCKETYGYGKNKKNSLHYYSTVKKVCGRKIVNKSKYEFWNRKKPKEKGFYLYRARSNINGRLTDVIYHHKFGTPVSLLKDGIRTERNYYNNGLLKNKITPYQTVEYKRYSKKCKKPEFVNIKMTDPKTKKILTSKKINFEFLGSCQLKVAKKSKDEWIKVKYDNKGRLFSMEDQSRKKVLLKWNNRVNRPELITRKGVGSVRISYNSKGQIQSIKGKSGASVMTQVASVFNTFLETLAPVAEEMAIL